jgi:hypothetical protein
LKGVYISLAELDALHGAGPFASTAYLWLRSWMDLRTAVVGLARPISLSMLRAYCEAHVPKGAGVQVVQPSERNIRPAIGALERAELLVRLPGEQLVFRLPLAAKPQLVQNIPDTVGKCREPSTGAASAGCYRANPTDYAAGSERSHRKSGLRPRIILVCEGNTHHPYRSEVAHLQRHGRG